MRCIISFMLLLVTSWMTAQGKYELIIQKDGQPGIIHIIEPGETLFGLAQICGGTVDQIQILNNLTSVELEIGSTIILPIFPDDIQLETNPSSDLMELYYVVHPGNTLYSLSRAISLQPNDLMALNEMTSTDIHPGEQIFLGWLMAKERTERRIREGQRKLITMPEHIGRKEMMPSSTIYASGIQNISTTIDSVTYHQAPSSIIIKERGIAYCERSSTDYKALIAMHPNAKVNSDISIYNPMLKRTVKAKVVGELPKEAYPEGVTVVISPSVAEALGALDRRFYVEITYEE